MSITPRLSTWDYLEILRSPKIGNFSTAMAVMSTIFSNTFQGEILPLNILIHYSGSKPIDHSSCPNNYLSRHAHTLYTHEWLEFAHDDVLLVWRWRHDQIHIHPSLLHPRFCIAENGCVHLPLPQCTHDRIRYPSPSSSFFTARAPHRKRESTPLDSSASTYSQPRYLAPHGSERLQLYGRDGNTDISALGMPNTVRTCPGSQNSQKLEKKRNG